MCVQQGCLSITADRCTKLWPCLCGHGPKKSARPSCLDVLQKHHSTESESAIRAHKAVAAYQRALPARQHEHATAEVDDERGHFHAVPPMIMGLPQTKGTQHLHHHQQNPQRTYQCQCRRRARPLPQQPRYHCVTANCPSDPYRPRCRASWARRQEKRKYSVRSAVTSETNQPTA